MPFYKRLQQKSISKQDKHLKSKTIAILCGLFGMVKTSPSKKAVGDLPGTCRASQTWAPPTEGPSSLGGGMLGGLRHLTCSEIRRFQNQVRLVNIPHLQSETHIPGGSLGFLNHQQYPYPTWQKGKSSTQKCQLVGDMWSFPRGYPEKTSTKKGSWPIFCQYNRSLYFQPKRMHSHKGNPSKLLLDRPKMYNWTTSAEAPAVHIENIPKKKWLLHTLQTCKPLMVFWSPAWTTWILFLTLWNSGINCQPQLVQDFFHQL